MVITCPKCVDGVLNGVTCVFCSGDSEIDLTDPNFRHVAEGNFRVVTGQVWSAIFTKLEANAEELDYIHGKVTAIWNAVKPPDA